MTIQEQERVIVFRRLVQDIDLVKKTDSELLDILNKAVLPNSLSANALNFSLLFNYLNDSTGTEKKIKKIKNLNQIFQRTEKELLRFGLMYGFDSYHAGYQFSRFIRNSADISKGERLVPKKISSKYFEQIFEFIYKIIYKGERNDRFPQI